MKEINLTTQLTKKLALFAIVLLLVSGFVTSKRVYAFGCSSGGTISVDVTLPNSPEMVNITDMSTYTTCSGNVGPDTQSDALRTVSATISEKLTSQGYAGYITTYAGMYSEPLDNKECVWPSGGDSNCSVSQHQGITTPLQVIISVKRTSSIGDGATIPAGTEIAHLELEQRSNNSWGWNRSWSFVLKHDLVIPAHTCNVDASTPSRVDLSPIPGSNLSHKGSTVQDTSFTIELKCNSNIGVSLFLDGAEDTDAVGNGVLAINKGPDKATGVGIQLLNNDLPVEFQKDIYVGTTSTEGIFKIPMVARYYRTTSLPVKAGDVSASVTYSLTYQ